eukprot:5682172-Ditylum_brightwellii.AAC.1
MTGLECCMGRDVQPNMGLGLFNHTEQGTMEEHETLIHMDIPLLSEFKGEQDEQWHLVLIADKTKSGFQPHLRTYQ